MDVYVAPETAAIVAEFAAIARSINVSLPAELNDGVVDTSNFPIDLDVESVAVNWGIVMLVIRPPVITTCACIAYVSLASGICTFCTLPMYVPSMTSLGVGDGVTVGDTVGVGLVVTLGDTVGDGNGETTARAVTRALCC